MVQGQQDGPLNVILDPGREDCQHRVIDELLCMVAGCALGTDVCHWLDFFLKVDMVQGQQDSPLTGKRWFKDRTVIKTEVILNTKKRSLEGIPRAQAVEWVPPLCAIILVGKIRHKLVKQGSQL